MPLSPTGPFSDEEAELFEKLADLVAKLFFDSSSRHSGNRFDAPQIHTKCRDAPVAALRNAHAVKPPWTLRRRGIEEMSFPSGIEGVRAHRCPDGLAQVRA